MTKEKTVGMCEKNLAFMLTEKNGRRTQTLIYFNTLSRLMKHLYKPALYNTIHLITKDPSPGAQSRQHQDDLRTEIKLLLRPHRCLTYR